MVKLVADSAISESVRGQPDLQSVLEFEDPLCCDAMRKRPLLCRQPKNSPNTDEYNHRGRLTMAEWFWTCKISLKFIRILKKHPFYSFLFIWEKFSWILDGSQDFLFWFLLNLNCGVLYFIGWYCLISSYTSVVRISRKETCFSAVNVYIVGHMVRPHFQ